MEQKENLNPSYVKLKTPFKKQKNSPGKLRPSPQSCGKESRGPVLPRAEHAPHPIDPKRMQMFASSQLSFWSEIASGSPQSGAVSRRTVSKPVNFITSE